MANERTGEQESGGLTGQQGGSLAEAIEEVQSMLVPLRQGEFSEKIGKISVYVQSAAKARDVKTLANFIRFAHLNLDAVLVAALEAVVWRPRLASKTDEHSSDPLNKYLVAGPWGHEYLRKRKVDLEDFDRELCELLGCGESAAGRIVRSYASLNRSIDELQILARY
jgi:hypothetical protein